jgi:hypothetical protein
MAIRILIFRSAYQYILTIVMVLNKIKNKKKRARLLGRVSYRDR